MLCSSIFCQYTIISANTNLTKHTYFLTKQHKIKDMYKKDENKTNQLGTNTKLKIFLSAFLYKNVIVVK